MNLEEERKIYIQTIQFLDKSTDDYLYLYDFVNGRLYFTDKISEKYPLILDKDGIPIEEWQKVVYSRDVDQLSKNLKDIEAGISEDHNMEYRLIDREGNKVWINCRGNVLKDKSGHPAFLMGSISESAVKHMVDTLTGLWNFEKFTEDMNKSPEEDEGYFMVLGVDNFRDINMKNGRTFGNHLLKMISEILENHSDGTMRLYRLDGDQFAIDFLRKKSEDVTEFYDIVKTELENYCTISAGVVQYSVTDRKDGVMVYQYAENALNRAKKAGKNMMLFFSSEDYQKNLDKIALQNELRDAVMNDFRGFFLCYQPQIDNRTFTVYGAEALLRFESPTKGVVSPAEFIPLLEQSRLICRVGEWVLQTAARQCLEWRNHIPEFHMSVNISYVQLRQEDIAARILDILDATGLPGNALTLEVTESMQLQDYSYFNKIFYEWKRRGVKIAIDDFGTGYSSLSYLKSIDIDETKIDRCFVTRIQCNAYNYRLLNNMIELAHCAQIQVCCEGVETEEELAALQELHPDVLQGFLFAKPYKKEEFEKIYFQKNSQEYKERIKKEHHFRYMNKNENIELLKALRKDEIVNIVENMEEIIYVSNKDTRELYYMNAAGRKLTGIYDYKGQNCYKVLHDQDQPCEDCAGRHLKRNEFSVWEKHSMGKHYIVKGKLIPWLGSMARLEIATEISDHLEEDGETIRKYIAGIETGNEI